MKPYTYLVKHKPTGKVYYGLRTANKVDPINDLWNEYFTSSKKVHNLIEETGKDSFEVEIRQTFDSVEKAIAWESKVLRRCNVLEKDIWLNGNIAGYFLPTEEIRSKISQYHKGKPKSEEHRRKISIANKGKKNEYAKTDEYRKKMSILKSGSGNAMFGKKHSQETLEKISLKAKGRSAHNKGKPMSEEQKRKQSEIMSGRTITDDHKAKISATLKSKGLKRDKKDCPYCQKNVPVNILARYHGERCKSKS